MPSTGSYCEGITGGVNLKDTECGSKGTNRKFLLGGEVNYGEERQQSVSGYVLYRRWSLSVC